MTNTGAEPGLRESEFQVNGKSRPSEYIRNGRSPPGESREGCFRDSLCRFRRRTRGTRRIPKLWLDRTVEYWQGLMDRAAKIEVPCRKATDALRAAHVCQLIASDHGVIKGGEGFYDEFFIRDGAYQIHGNGGGRAQ